VLTLFLPFYLALLVYRPWHKIGAHGALTDDSGLRWFVRSRWLCLASGLAVAWVGVVFLATLSRAAYVGMAISTIFLLAYRWPRVRPAVRSVAFGLVLLFGLWLAWSLVSDPSQGRPLSETIPVPAEVVDLGRTESASGSFTWRLALWSLVLELIAQHPWAGIGFNMLPPYSEQVPYMDGYLNALHAHNLVLQAALDLGLPGLGCVLAILTIALASCCRALRDLRGTSHEAVVAGIMGALLAFLVATLADIVPLGSKSSVFFWTLLGLAVCLPRAHRTTRQELPRMPRWCRWRKPFRWRTENPAARTELCRANVARWGVRFGRSRLL
jgi:putative inorganic carbon (HCO3(-)) transporter